MSWLKNTDSKFTFYMFVMMKNILALFWLLSAACVCAQLRLPGIPPERPFWFILEEGKKALREGNYGVALSLFEEARVERKLRYTRMETEFVSLLSINEVRRLGDSLELVETYMEERNQFDAAAALAELSYHVGREALNGSARTTLGLFRRMKEYPEAEFWIGEVYRLEGEYVIALKQFQKALDFNIESEAALRRSEVLYKIAEVNRDLQNYAQMEEVLLQILNDDPFWVSSRTFIRGAMTNTLGKDGINHFLLMFRHKNDSTERAHRMLGEFYYKSGRYFPAESHLSFAVLEQSTAIIDEALRQRFDFTFTTLDDLMFEISRRSDIKKYINEVEYYRTLYYLGAALFANGKNTAAQSIWVFLSKHPEAGEWSRRAGSQMRSPFIEAPIK